MIEIIRNLARHKLRSTLTISGIVIGIFALTTMGAMAAHFNQQLDVGVQYYGSSIQVGAPDGQQIPLLPLSRMDQIRAVEGVEAVFPSYSLLVNPGASFSFGGPAATIVNWIPEQVAHMQPKTSIAQGHDISPDAGGEVVLGTTVASTLKKRVGDTLDLPVKPADAGRDFVSHPFTVVGILNPTGTAPDGFAYVSTADARMLFADTLPPAIQNSIDLSQIAPGFTVYGTAGASLSQLDAMANRINAQVPSVKAIKPSISVNGYKQFVAIFTAITTGAAILALLIGGLSVINTMVMAVSERVREIGLKKALGAHTSHILREYLLEAALIGLISGVIGYLLGVGLTSLINVGSASSLQLFSITPTLTVETIGFAVVLSALAGVLPALRAARLDPVTALRTTN
ncbi:MAG TPA: FtsX-like permease family protein [Ktedonobacterales bacterium]|nr:FtsX-like permease family protein [Ktedonobacterales bacterium]